MQPPTDRMSPPGLTHLCIWALLPRAGFRDPPLSEFPGGRGARTVQGLNKVLFDLNESLLTEYKHKIGPYIPPFSLEISQIFDFLASFISPPHITGATINLMNSLFFES